MKKCIIAALSLLIIWNLAGCMEIPEVTEPVPVETTVQTQPMETTEPPRVWNTGYVAALEPAVAYVDEQGNQVGTFIRGDQVLYDGQELLVEEQIVYLQSGSVVADVADAIPEHTLYVRSAVNLRDADGRLLETFMDKGAAVTVTGYDYLENGVPHMYQVDETG